MATTRPPAPSARKEDFTALTDWDGERLTRVLDLALALKRLHVQGRDPQPFRGLNAALLFQKPSLRTRVSFEVGFRQLGGESLYLSPAEVGLGVRETVPDVARVLSSYVDAIVARVFSHAHIEELARWSRVPIVNALSDYNHPCQVFADLLTVLEIRKTLDGLKVAWVGDGNNVAVSWINAARRLPIEVRLACPAGYDPDGPTMKAAEREAPGRVHLGRDPREAVRGAHVVYADTWYSMGQEAEKEKRRAEFRGYTITAELMKLAAPDACFMHCLPAHRGDEVTDEVFEGPQSVVFQEAENRLHGQKAILLSVMAKESAVI